LSNNFIAAVYESYFILLKWTMHHFITITIYVYLFINKYFSFLQHVLFSPNSRIIIQKWKKKNKNQLHKQIISKKVKKKKNMKKNAWIGLNLVKNFGCFGLDF
jgi:hypothetical protein